MAFFFHDLLDETCNRGNFSGKTGNKTIDCEEPLETEEDFVKMLGWVYKATTYHRSFIAPGYWFYTGIILYIFHYWKD